MNALPLVALLAMLPQGKDAGTFSDAYVGLEFTYPKTWTVAKKTKDTTKLEVPIEGSTEKAELEVIRTAYHSSKQTWQTIQLRANETLKREIVRQWEQDLIGVPMLLTQVNWTDKGGTARTTLSGLYYTRGALKLLMKLTAPATEFDKARYEFQNALQTLKTTDGKPPQEDDENLKIEPKAKPEPVAPRPKVISAEVPSTHVVKPPVTVPMVISTKPVVLRLPQGWKASEVKDGKMTITSDKLSGPVTVEVRSTLDSEPAGSALLHQSGPRLDDFKVGLLREDTSPTANQAGCQIATVWRTGKAATSGDLTTFDGVGQQGDFYVLLSFRSTEASKFKNDRKAIRALLDQVSLESSQP